MNIAAPRGTFLPVHVITARKTINQYLVDFYCNFARATDMRMRLKLLFFIYEKDYFSLHINKYEPVDTAELCYKQGCSTRRGQI